MTDAQALEGYLTADLATLRDRFVDEEFCSELYRALAGNSLSKHGDEPTGHVSLSWRRAEDIVNALRKGVGRERMSLAQTGGEGEVSGTVADELRRLGWAARPRDPSRHDDAHVASPPGPPPEEQGERQAPADPAATRWEEQGHAEAERERARRG